MKSSSTKKETNQAPNKIRDEVKNKSKDNTENLNMTKENGSDEENPLCFYCFIDCQ